MFFQDPMILLSYINTQLRDFYLSLDELCEGLSFDKEELMQKLKTVGYEYVPELNQFR